MKFVTKLPVAMIMKRFPALYRFKDVEAEREAAGVLA